MAQITNTIDYKRPNYNYGDPKAEHHYCQQFDTSFYKDQNLSKNAKLILAFLLSNNETYVNTTNTLKYNLGIGRDAVKTALQNLEDQNYIRRIPVSHGKNDISYSWKISAYPRTDFPPVVRNHVNNLRPTENQLTENQLNDNLRPTENQLNDNDVNSLRPTENQLTENQLTENQLTENQLTYINNKIQTNEISIINTDKNGDTSTGILDKKSSPEGSIFYSENFAPQATQNVPQFDDVIFEKIKAESKVLMKDLPQPKLKLNSEIKNENNKLNESDTAMKIKLNNEYFDDNEMFVDDTTAISKIEDEINKLDSINASTANEYSAQENIKLDGDTDSVHSEIDVITPNIEMTEQQKLNDNLYDKAFNLFGDGLYAKIDNLDAMIDDEFGEDARKKLISNSDIVDDTDWKPIGKIDTTELKANAVKLMNKAFDTITAVDPTLDI